MVRTHVENYESEKFFRFFVSDASIFLLICSFVAAEPTVYFIVHDVPSGDGRKNIEDK